MQIVFNNQKSYSLYWRGITLNYFNGRTWRRQIGHHDFKQLPLISEDKGGDYDVLLEPHEKNWLFYQNNPVAARPYLLYSPLLGLVRLNKNPIYQRMVYSVIDQPVVYQPLDSTLYQQNIRLPEQGNLQLRAWAKEKFDTVHQHIPSFVKAIAQYIQNEPFWYSLKPGEMDDELNFMDQFWFQSRRGYCEQYASAVVILFRAVKIPARVVIGYYGGEWNNLGKFLTVRQRNAHAWVEYWQEEMGWTRFDPVRYIAPERINVSLPQDEGLLTHWGFDSSGFPLTTRFFWALDSARFFWERWFVFYNHEGQKVLLQKLGFESVTNQRLLQSSIGVLLFFILCSAAWYYRQDLKRGDRLYREYHKLQRVIARLGVSVHPPNTFSGQIHDLMAKFPQLSALLNQYYAKYEALRLKTSKNPKKNRTATLELFKSLRKLLKKVDPHQRS